MIRMLCGVSIIASIALLLALPGAAATQPHLVDQRGKQFQFDELRGRPLVVTFVAATCTEACPLINAQFEQLQEKLESAHASARLLTITLDPDRDTPAVMRALAHRFEARPERWIVASGAPADIRTVLRVFGVRVGDDHTTFVYLFDKEGVLRERMLANTNLADVIIGRLRKSELAR